MKQATHFASYYASAFPFIYLKSMIPSVPTPASGSYRAQHTPAPWYA